VRGDRLRRNLGRIREAAAPGARLLPMVKADAYGLGMRSVVEALRPEDPWGFGVATVDEGITLRGIERERPILVFAPAPPGAVEAGIEARLTLAVSDVSLLERIHRAAEGRGVEAAVHVEVDTGMGRAGFDGRGVGSWGPAVAGLTGGAVRWEGCFTHFHSADEGPESVREQMARFEAALEALPVPRDELLVHVCNSAGILRDGALGLDLVRPGLFLYGGRAGVGLPEPEPVVAVRSRVGLVREVPPGTTVGYGATYRAAGAERWATVGIGYGDGLRRALADGGEAIVRGRRVPIRGRISMDMTVVDITNVPGVAPGDVVTWLGRDGGEEITLTELARGIGTNEYEVLTGFGPRLRRIWVEETSD
jgi:alanine racemase